MKTNKNGIPDILAIKDGKCHFFEIKRDEKHDLSELQKFRFKELEQIGCKCQLINSL